MFFNKPPTRFETINDIDNAVINFFKACRDYPDELARAINLTPFSRHEFNEIQESRAGEEIKLTGDCVEDARRFAVRCNQGFGSKLADRVGWKNTKHSSGPVNSRIWNKIPYTIYEVADRLKNAQIENTDAVELIKACNGSDCLIYVDPPYLEGTRRSRIYRHEMMDTKRHKQMLEALLNHAGPVVISGYENDLYNTVLDGWYKESKNGRANSGAERVETLWMNFVHNTQMSLLKEGTNK